MIYDDFKEKLIKELETKKDLIIIRNTFNRPESLFEISDTDDKMYIQVLKAFERIAIQNVEILVEKLCALHNISCKLSDLNTNLFDMTVNINGEEKYVEFKSSFQAFNTDSFHRLANMVEKSDYPVCLVFLLKNSVASQQEMRQFFKRFSAFKKNITIECYIFESFLELVFGKKEMDDFHKAMVTFKQEMHQAIGYQLTELCSPQNMQKLKNTLENELLCFDYDSIKAERYAFNSAGNSNVHDLNNHNYQIIKSSFLSNGYKSLLGSKDFAESFTTSEWLYKKYCTLDDLDNTFIVSGYFKSIEQLLWNILLIVGEGKQIGGVDIIEANIEQIDSTLGSLQNFFSDYDNDDLFQNAFGNGKNFVMRYLKAQTSNWRKKYRNGYFHKQNLKDIDNINAIREETYYLYMLILGSLHLNQSSIASLIS